MSATDEHRASSSPLRRLGISVIILLILMSTVSLPIGSPHTYTPSHEHIPPLVAQICQYTTHYPSTSLHEKTPCHPLGSAVFFSGNSFLTAQHVVPDPEARYGILIDNAVPLPIHYIIAHPQHDLALVMTHHTDILSPPAILATTPKKTQTPVIAISPRRLVHGSIISYIADTHTYILSYPLHPSES